MVLNYLLLVVCGGYSVFGVIQMKKGTSKPFRTVGAIIVFFIALAATVMGISYIELKTMIEGWFMR
ncbi:MAG: hypothetical protein LBD04_04470 [Synergistaceae bacterium]|jgi:hypothetical protein|nr:hypothetical protein [Synergistaceae bacterium]